MLKEAQKFVWSMVEDIQEWARQTISCEGNYTEPLMDTDGVNQPILPR
jgi:hypothetical protein